MSSFGKGCFLRCAIHARSNSGQRLPVTASMAALSLAPLAIAVSSRPSAPGPDSVSTRCTAKKTSAKAVAASSAVGSSAIDGCIFSKGTSVLLRTRAPSSASVEGVIAPPGGPRHLDSRYFARPSCIQMGTVLRDFWLTTRCTYSCARVSSQS